MKTELANYAMLTDRKYDQNWYEWCVFVLGDRQALDEIVQVRYVLHPTFPDPVRVITDEQSRFALFSSGWGEFSVQAEVTMKNDTKEFLTYWLKLKNEWPTVRRPERFNTTEAKSIYEVLAEGRFRWRKLSTISSRTGITEEQARRVLRLMSDANLTRMLPTLSIDGQELWAATSIVGISPRV